MICVSTSPSQRATTCPSLTTMTDGDPSTLRISGRSPNRPGCVTVYMNMRRFGPAVDDLAIERTAVATESSSAAPGNVNENTDTRFGDLSTDVASAGVRSVGTTVSEVESGAAIATELNTATAATVDTRRMPLNPFVRSIRRPSLRSVWCSPVGQHIVTSCFGMRRANLNVDGPEC